MTAELLKVGGNPVLKVLQKIFDSILFGGKPPEAWFGTVVVLFFQNINISYNMEMGL